MEAQRQAADEELEALGARFTEEELIVRRIIRVVSHVAEGILESAAEKGVDVVAIASHGYGRLKRVALGSVADKVIRGADSPVLVVRPRSDWRLGPVTVGTSPGTQRW